MTQRTWTDEELAVYRATARRRREQDRDAEKARREKAWAAARLAAGILKNRYHASRVVVFGSLAQKGARFTRWSDVDIAAWGLKERDWLRALGTLLDLDVGFQVNMVDVTTCTPELLATIEQDGVEI